MNVNLYALKIKPSHVCLWSYIKSSQECQHMLQAHWEPQLQNSGDDQDSHCVRPRWHQHKTQWAQQTHPQQQRKRRIQWTWNTHTPRVRCKYSNTGQGYCGKKGWIVRRTLQRELTFIHSVQRVEERHQQINENSQVERHITPERHVPTTPVQNWLC